MFYQHNWHTEPTNNCHQQRNEALAFNLTMADKDRDPESKQKYKVLKYAQNQELVITKQSIFFFFLDS